MGHRRREGCQAGQEHRHDGEPLQLDASSLLLGERLGVVSPDPGLDLADRPQHPGAGLGLTHAGGQGCGQLVERPRQGGGALAQ